MNFKRLLALIMAIVTMLSIGGVSAQWMYFDVNANLDIEERLELELSEYYYPPPPIPTKEKLLVERLEKILNQEFSNDVVTDSRDYLINETIQVYYNGDIYANPYVGSMDKTFAYQLNQLFGDLVVDENLSFILKSQDYNWDGYREVAIYTTSDPLDAVKDYDGVVCVYVTVFTPYLDANKNIIGYNQVCESVRGYCTEVLYDTTNNTPSFSTDDWRDDLGYWSWEGPVVAIPKDVMNSAGDKPYREDYYAYNKSYEFAPGCWSATSPHGNQLWVYLADMPYLY